MFIFLGLGVGTLAAQEPGPPLPGTKPLTMRGDIASELVAGVDRFLLRQIDESTANRPRFWKRDFSSAKAYEASVEPNRKRLAHILGVRDRRASVPGIRRIVDPSGGVNKIFGNGQKGKKDVHFVSWPAFGDVTGEGLELGTGETCVIVVPDADQTPEQLAGLVPGVPPASQVGRRLAESHCHVFIPTLIDRTVASRNGRARLTNREFIYRSAFELGRHVIGYEVQKVLALVDALERECRGRGRELRLGIFGYGEGGAIALYAAALDPRIKAACVSGYFGDRNDVWRQPVDRNVFGLLEQFGDAEVASLVAPRTLIVEAARGPEFVIPPGTGGAPGRLTTPGLRDRDRGGRAGTGPGRRAQSGSRISNWSQADRMVRVRSGPTRPWASSSGAIDPDARLEPAGPDAASDRRDPKVNARLVEVGRDRQARQLHELDRHNQQLLVESPYTRQEFMKKLDTRSADAYARSVEPYREFFAEEVIGRFDLKPLAAGRPLAADLRRAGIHRIRGRDGCLPRGHRLRHPARTQGDQGGGAASGRRLPARPGGPAARRRRPEGRRIRPTTNMPSGWRSEDSSRLHPRISISSRTGSAPSSARRIRSRRRLFSVIVPQHQQITDWLKTLPFVDPSGSRSTA